MAAQVLEMNGGGFDLDDAVDAVDLDAAPPPPAEGVKVAIAESESDDEAALPQTAAAPSAAGTAGASSAKAGSATAAKAQTAASHTYDKGYKRWEDFDVDAAADAVDVDDSFQKAETYTGSKPGYVFKTGARGTGYYKDAKPKVVAPSKPPPKKKAPAPTTTKDGVDLTLPLFSSVPENQRPAAARALSLDDAALAQLPDEQQKTIRDFKRCYEKQKADKAA